MINSDMYPPKYKRFINSRTMTPDEAARKIQNFWKIYKIHKNKNNNKRNTSVLSYVYERFASWIPF